MIEPPVSDNVDLHISPYGMLRDSVGTFANGNGAGILSLTGQTLPEEAHAARYFQKIFIDYIRRLYQAGDAHGRSLPDLFQVSRPGREELAFLALAAPPMLGGEYFDADLLYQFHTEFESAVHFQYKRFSGTFTDFVRSLSPAWENVGKVSFHLAENKGTQAEDFPFAFMSSFIYRAEGDKPKHLPLATAFKAYIHDKEALASLLSPLQRAAEKSEFLAGLLESRRVFQPSAWTSYEAYQFLQDIPVFEEANIVVFIANLWKKTPPRIKCTVALDVAKKKRLGAEALLDFSVAVTMDGEHLTQADIDALLNSTGGLVRIKGQWVLADPEVISALLEQWQEAERLRGEGGMSLLEGFRLLAGITNEGPMQKTIEAQEHFNFEPSGELKKMLDDLHSPSGIKLPALPAQLDKTLRPYQRDGVKYLWRSSALGLGSCLADDMGLGKTLQILALICLWKKAGALDKLPVLLVLPATLLANWKSESAKFTPDLQLTILHSSAMSKEAQVALADNAEAYLQPYDIALTTYGMVPRISELASIEFPAVIVDEAQAIKNPHVKQSKAVRNLRSKHRIALTGTPVENRLTDLWSIFDFINPGLLGNLHSFINFTSRLGENYSPLRRLTHPFILRRLKTDKRIISDLPDKTELKVYCNLSKRQAVLYSKVVSDMAEALQKEAEEGIQRRGIVLAALMQFKQICNHPGQYLGNGDYSHEASGKFLRIEELVESIVSRQEKLLVFTQFREMTTPLHDYLQKCFGRPGLILHGGTPVKERANLVNAFQSDEGPPFFVLSLKAGGTGLNLTAANHVIHFDRWWNPAVENQASDRAFRIGQKRNVLVHKFICKGTLEERIDELIMDKQNLADEILSGGAEKLLTSMNNAELLDLVKLDINTIE